MKSRLKILIAEKELRENRNLTLRTIAKETGVSMYTIQALSKGDIHSIPVDSMEALFDYFDCNFDDLFQREKKKSRGNDSPALAAA